MVVTNPPYVSARNLPPEMVQRLKGRFPTAWRDLLHCFIQRCVAFCRPGGRTGLLAMQSFMFTGSVEECPAQLLDEVALEAVAHFGPGLFNVGNPGTLQTAGVVLRHEPDPAAPRPDGAFIRLVDEDGPEAKRRALEGCSAPTTPRWCVPLAACPPVLPKTRAGKPPVAHQISMVGLVGGQYPPGL